MFINAGQIEENSSFHCMVCIIGAGVAGITIALELQKSGIDVCLLESGGFTPDNATRDLNRGESSGQPYNFSDGCRSRYFGGSSNDWGGWCAPLDSHDFAKRDWVNESGWPFNKEELTPYYQKAHDVLKLGPYNYDPSFWEKAINHPEVRRMVSNDEMVVDKISQFSLPLRMGKTYKDKFSNDKIRIFLYANVTAIECQESGNHVTQVNVKTLNGANFFVTSRLFILAAGGIENARILLTSDKVHKNGIGNNNDLVGRYFMDHPRFISGQIFLSNQWSRNRLYDLKYHYHSRVVSAFGTCIASQFAIHPELQKREGILNARVSLSSVFKGEGSQAAISLRNLNKISRKKGIKELRLSREFLQVITDPLNAVAFSASKYFRPHFLVNRIGFQIIIEQEPDPGSRVTLSNGKDQLGMRRVKINWRIGEKEKYTIDRTLDIIAQSLKQSGVAEKIILEDKLTSNEWPAKVEGTWHHIGTTRMHASPAKGVVDENCKVHGVENLYLAGSSVFPTSGANFPTITLTALALRLSDHINKRITSEQYKNSNNSILRPVNAE